MSLFQEVLIQNADLIGSLGEQELSLLEAHYELLERWNRRLNLTSIRRVEEIAERHYCESVWLARRVCGEARSVADIGTGAGFPGFPMGALYPECRVKLVESHSRKCVFLRESTRTCPNVEVFEGRAEELVGDFEWVVSRAVRYEIVLRAARIAGARVALLIGGTDCEPAKNERGFVWQEPVSLPWGDQRFLLVGEVERD